MFCCPIFGIVILETIICCKGKEEAPAVEAAPVEEVAPAESAE